MATASVSDQDLDEVCAKLKECVLAAKAVPSLKKEEACQFNAKVCKRMVNDTGVPKKCADGFDIALSACKKSGKGFVNLDKKDEVNDFIDRCGKEYAAVLLKKPPPKVTDDEKKAHTAKLCECIKKTQFKAESKGTANKGTTDRLTDTSKYTGAHKERFDAEGKGKGAEGRVDKADSSGYVGNYKGQGTYGKK